jgi:hypothetical protein
MSTWLRGTNCQPLSIFDEGKQEYETFGGGMGEWIENMVNPTWKAENTVMEEKAKEM